MRMRAILYLRRVGWWCAVGSRQFFSGRAGSFDLEAAGGAFQEELEDLDVAAGLVEVSPPSIQAVLANEIAVLERAGRIFQALADLLGQGGDVLGVVEDFDPPGGIVRGDAGQPLEHLVAGDLETTLSEKQVREDGGPDRMGVEHRPDVWLGGGDDVQ